MTTKPKAKKFRIRRSPSLEAQDGQQPAQAPAANARGAGGAAAPAPGSAQRSGPGQAPQQPRHLNPLEESVADGTEDGFPDRGFSAAGHPTGRSDAPGGPSAAANPAAQAGEAEPVAAEQEIADIRKEGLTGRQLRMARRLAQKHGLPATSDYDAVRLLRRAGIDPFHRSNMLELITPENTQPQPAGKGQMQLPQTTSNKPQLPSADVMDAAARARSVQQIQADIATRRRRKLMVLAVRLAFFVLLPTLLAGYYFYNIATPMYATKSEFVIQKADAGTSPFSSFLSGSGLANSQDSITVQSYLTSRDAMLRLDKELGFKALFQDPSIDPIHRLDPNATNEAAYKVYKKNVKIGYDPTEGIIKMEVVAPSPELSEQISKAL
ncbi:MAG TPA: capsule biosynthesis protein, partial [Rhodobacterales bacterium]|nr:capsule biosynthesis protein [Rhodobacterales bacterium]